MECDIEDLLPERLAVDDTAEQMCCVMAKMKTIMVMEMIRRPLKRAVADIRQASITYIWCHRLVDRTPLE